MKTNQMFLAGMLMIFSASKVYAHCDKVNLEGTFKNHREGRFHVAQPTCDRLIVTDLNNHLVYEADFNNPSNPINLGDVRSIPADLSRLLPISVGGKMGFDWQSEHFDDAMTLYLQTRIHLKKTDLLAGLHDPMIRAKVGVFVSRPGPQYAQFNIPTSLSVFVVSFEAVSEPGDSAKQKLFVHGINVGLSVMSRFIGDRGLVYEYLTEVH